MKATSRWTAAELEALRLQMRDPANTKRIFSILHRSRDAVARMLKFMPKAGNTNDAWRDLAMLEQMMREEGLLPPIEAQFDRGMQ